MYNKNWGYNFTQKMGHTLGDFRTKVGNIFTKKITWSPWLVCSLHQRQRLLQRVSRHPLISSTLCLHNHRWAQTGRVGNRQGDQMCFLKKWPKT
jgi:hypothetical protein